MKIKRAVIIASLWITSRLALALCLYLFRGVWARVNISEQPPLASGFLDLFAYYDTYNYANISIHGYFSDRMCAFFPLFPLILAIFRWIAGINPYWGAFAINNILLLFSLFTAEKLLVNRNISQERRTAILMIIAFFPSAYFFSAGYTESLFLFLALLSFLLWEKDKRFWAYAAAGLLCLTRFVGFFLPLAFIAERLIQKKLDKKDLFYAVLSAFIGSLFPLYMWMDKGDPLKFQHVLFPIFQRESSWFPKPIWQEAVWFAQKMNVGIVDFVSVMHFVLIAVAAGYFWSACKAGKQTRLAETMFAAGLVMLPLSTILHKPFLTATHGFIRYAAVVFPLLFYMGEKLSDAKENQRFRYAMFLVAWALCYIWMNYELSGKWFVA